MVNGFGKWKAKGKVDTAGIHAGFFAKKFKGPIIPSALPSSLCVKYPVLGNIGSK